MVVVKDMELKDVQQMKEKFSKVKHVKDVLWYDDVADISLPVEMIPKDLRESFFKGDATMMLVLFDNTTSSDDAMDALTQLRHVANKQCFISGMTGIVTDIKNIAMAGTASICGHCSSSESDCSGADMWIFRRSCFILAQLRTCDFV